MKMDTDLEDLVKSIRDLANGDSWYSKRMETEKTILQTNDLEIALLNYAIECKLYAFGREKLNKDEVKSILELIRRGYDELIAREPENPILWWRLAWFLSMSGFDKSEDLRTALLNVIKFSRTHGYKHTKQLVSISRRVLWKDYGMTSLDVRAELAKIRGNPGDNK